jgi:hypothetical protein
VTEIYGLIRAAVLERKCVAAVYGGHFRQMCPHVLGTKAGRAQALFYQFGGSSASGLAPDGSAENWRCIPLDALHDVAVYSGPWHSAANYGRREQTCVEVIDVEV